ncbi:hypothetical protein Tdes44962_MAKER07167 [Teratosphaeria destructans]|uniref:Methyltransferase domain-containing protein n=1 Tax=Teratosphaeria destructans TaxID=418781 RepID=A0A9W7SZY9_9PEZI|nr:hypothetical protein Tdes44962_MAKER07167 [Teratosphaeria destructans]
MSFTFSDQEYWEKRFRKDKCAFDWLLPAPALRDMVAQVLTQTQIPSPRILHIGCGTSELPSELRSLVEKPSQVHNVDYSQAAVEAGMQAELRGISNKGLSPADECTRWCQLDLLSLPAILDLKGSKEAPYDLVVDKSTSDAISCGRDLLTSLPYPLIATTPTTPPSQAKLHPLHILAVHLAALTRPGLGRWVAVSYAEDRFPFLAPYPKSPIDGLMDESIISMGFTHPGELWELQKKWKIRAPSGKLGEPDVFYWVYVLRRTKLALACP